MNIKIATCVPLQCYDRQSKLVWLQRAIEATDCHLFLTPQEYFGGLYIMPKDLHVDYSWLQDVIGGLCIKYKKAIGVGACVTRNGHGAMEEYIYFSLTGRELGVHRKFALPAYDDVRAHGGGKLWPESSYAARIRPIQIAELGLTIGTVFCWEVFSLTIFPAYSMAGVNLIVHPIKFAPRGWLKLAKDKESILKTGGVQITGFGNAPKSEIWVDKLRSASRHEIFCPIAVSCNSWALGEKFAALTGWVDEIRGKTQLYNVPSTKEANQIYTFDFDPKWVDGFDAANSAGQFKSVAGTIEDFSSLGQWTMHRKMRRLEAQLMGGTTRLDLLLKANTQNRQKISTVRRAAKYGIG